MITLGPPSAEDVLREALAYGADDAVLVSDPAFAGSDTLATARALAATLARMGDVDLVLCGRNSVDAETGQVGPELAQLLDLPFATGVKHLELESGARRCGSAASRTTPGSRPPWPCPPCFARPSGSSSPARSRIPRCWPRSTGRASNA